MKEGVHTMNMYQNTISNLCAGVENTNETTAEFIKRVATGWVDMAARHGLVMPPKADALDALQALADCINDAPAVETNVENYFGVPIAFGSFKECYPWTSQYVIKFCARRNPTVEEQSIIMRAAEHNVGHFFIPSIYLQLPRLIDSQNLDKEDDESEIYDPETHTWTPNPDWEDDTIFTHICIQPRVAPLGDSEDNSRQFSNHEKDWGRMVRCIPQLAGEDRKDWFILAGTCLNWLIDFSHYYGKTGLTALRDFCETFGIWDLHSENTGNLIPSISGRAAPIILDWMSR